MRGFRASVAFYWVFVFKLGSTFAQMYLMSMIATNGSSQEPFLNLQTIAHLGAWAAALRGVDALMDPVFQKLNPFKMEVAPPPIPPVVSPQKDNP